MDSKKETIAVGISGGVDSSVAAYLLKKQGYNVVGIFVKTWSPEWLPCTWVDEKRDAMRVCAALDIPFYFLDAEEEYKNGVAQYMIDEYRAGRTPNPDVLCNRIIKFGALWKYAQSLGATKIATGHYVQTDGKRLFKAKDYSKDQTYFLWMLEQQELSHIVFPLGNLEKDEVRKIAEKAKLFTATKKDSQGICFLGDVDMREFLSHYIDQKKGDILDMEGNVVGVHDGVWFYTLGERRGFKITTKDTEREPYYVVDKDIEKNILIVSKKDKEGGLGENEQQKIILRETSLHIKPEFGKEYFGQIRYHGNLIPLIFEDEKTIILNTKEPIPLGQSLVIYEDDIVVGGGIIDKK